MPHNPQFLVRYSIWSVCLRHWRRIHREMVGLSTDFAEAAAFARQDEATAAALFVYKTLRSVECHDVLERLAAKLQTLLDECAVRRCRFMGVIGRVCDFEGKQC